MALSHRTDLLTLCAALQQAGIWLFLNEENALVLGPTSLVKKHPALLEGVRAQKALITQLLEESLAHGLFGEKDDDPRFEQETCPECQQACYIILWPRRLGVHRLPDRKTVCPGSDRAQQTTADVIMQAFIVDRCVPHTGAVLTWYGLRGALEAWCAERSFLLPPRPFLLAWMDAQYTRLTTTQGDLPMWTGLTLTIEEWLGDKEERPNEQTPTVPVVTRKRVLKA